MVVLEVLLKYRGKRENHGPEELGKFINVTYDFWSVNNFWNDSKSEAKQGKEKA